MPFLLSFYLTHFNLAATGLANCGNGKTCDTGLPVVGAGNKELQQVLQIVIATFAALTVLMIVISGLRFVMAQGNPEETAKARNTIIYSVIGLAVAISAEAIVSLVLGKL